MTTNKIIVLLGLVVAAMPFLGFPHAWEDAVFITSGVLIVALSLLNLWQRKILKKLSDHAERADTFTENANAQFSTEQK